MATRTWDETYPNGAVDTVSILDNAMKNMKVDIREREHQGGRVYSSATTAHDGRCCVANADNNSTSWAAYKSDKVTKLIDPTDSQVNITENLVMGSGKNVQGVNVTSGNNPGHGHDFTISVPLPANATGRVTGVLYHNLGNGQLTLLEVVPFCFTAPSGGTVDFDIHQLAAGYTDPNAAGNSVFGANPKPSIASGAFTGASRTVFDGTYGVVPVTGALAFEIDTLTAPAADLVLAVKMRRI